MNPQDLQYNSGHDLPYTGIPLVTIAAVGLMLIGCVILWRIWEAGR